MTKYLPSVISVDNIEWICETCNNHLKKGRVPPCAIANGMQFAKKTSFFDLNELECQLIAPQLAFQKIFQAPRGGQLKITGNIVNVPADVNSTVNMLPRLPDEAGTMKVQLKTCASDETAPDIPEDEWSEDEAEIPAGTTDSMLTI